MFHLYADEFQSFATDSFALILSEARKYGLTLTLAHQYLDQLPDQLRSAVFGNAGSIVACRSGAEDAAILAAQIGLNNPDALLDLANFSAWAQLLRGGVPTSPIRIDLYDAPRERRPDAHRLVETSRRRFGRPRARSRGAHSPLSVRLITGITYALRLDSPVGCASVFCPHEILREFPCGSPSNIANP